MNELVSQIRKAAGLSQKSFGEKVGVGRDVIANIENNRAPMSDLLFRHILDVYHVSERWVKTGEGYIFQEDADSALNRSSKQYNLSDSARHIIEIFVNLPDNQKELLYDKIVDAARVINAERSKDKYRNLPTYEEALANARALSGDDDPALRTLLRARTDDPEDAAGDEDTKKEPPSNVG